MIGIPELLLILAIILIVFGAGKLPEIGDALGRGIRAFKKANSGPDEIDVTPRAERLEEPSRNRSSDRAYSEAGRDRDRDARDDRPQARDDRDRDRDDRDRNRDDRDRNRDDRDRNRDDRDHNRDDRDRPAERRG